MKKVFCKNCKYFRQVGHNSYCAAFELDITKDIRRYKRGIIFVHEYDYPNRNNDCSYYKFY